MRSLYDHFLLEIRTFWGKEYNFLILAAIIGFFAGMASTFFRWMISGCEWLFSEKGMAFFGLSGNSTLFLLPLMPLLGGLIIGILWKYFPEVIAENGIHKVIEAVALKNGKVKRRSLFVCAITSSITIGSGGSAGRVGPTVQICSAIGSAIGQFFKLSTERIRVLVGCGSAAGIAATFNAPLAGVLFSMEIILGEFTIRTFSPIIIASVIGTVTGRAIEGNELTFQTPLHEMVSPIEIIFYLILGVICGHLARAYIHSYFWSQKFFSEKVPLPIWAKPALGGLMVGLIAIFLPQIKGNGFPFMEQALNGNMIWQITFALIFFKLIATILCLGSGGIGGTFAPSLFIGSMLGATFGTLVHTIFPSLTATSESYALVGMGAVTSAVLQAPLTCILILFEMTNDYTIILPIMGCCIVSTYTLRNYNKNSLYIQNLINDGINIRHGRAVSILSSIYVRDVMNSEVVTIPSTLALPQLKDLVSKTNHSYYPIVDTEEKMVGILTFSDLREVALSKEISPETTAIDLATKDVMTLTPNYNLQETMEKFTELGVDQLPVVQIGDKQKIIGFINRSDVLAVYNREILIQGVQS